MGVLDILAGGAIGGITSAINTQQQLGLQSNLMEMQDRYNAIQTARNTQAQLDLWQKTNYPAQVEQLNKAGLNPALLYGKGGGGGTTASANTVNNPAPTAQRPMEIQQLMGLALQNELQKAQIKNINADTKGKEINNANEDKGGINQQVKEANINNLIANTENTEAKTSLTKAQETAQKLANGITEGTMQATIQKAINEFKTGANILYRSDKETDFLKNNLEAAEQNFKNNLAKSGIENLLMQTEIGKNRQNIKESRERVELMKTKILDLLNQMTNRTANTEINSRNATSNERNADVNKLNQMNNVDRLDFEHQKLNVTKILQEQGLSIQETRTVIEGLRTLTNLLK